MKPVANEPLKGVGIEGILVLVEGVGKHREQSDCQDETTDAFQNRRYAHRNEEATWRYLRERQREKRDAHEIERINEHAERLNAEALDVLSLQSEE